MSAYHAERLLAKFDETPGGGALWGVAATDDGARGWIILGGATPPAPAAREARVGDAIEGEVSFDQRYKGNDGMVHGGQVAMLFDELLGHVQSLTWSRPAVTAHLELDYLIPVPLERPLQFACRVADVAGRKISVEGTLADGERVLVKARALFVTRSRSLERV